jgi:cytochrome c oxidase assembly factor CtaG
VTVAVPTAPRRAWVPGFRRCLAVVGVLLWFVCLVPPITSWAHRYEYIQSIQFAALGFWVPALLAAGAPWQHWRLARVNESGEITGGVLHERRRVSQGRALSFTALFIAMSIFWRLAPLVNAVTEHEWIVVVEALTLTGAGVALMCDIIESPPLRPGVSRPYRIALSAAVMWSAWVFVYLEALSHTSWYRAFQHVAGRSLSVSADQQLSAASVWFMTGVVFVPVIFWNLVHWLQAEEDPDDELQRMVRQERTRGFFGYRSDDSI